MKLKIVAWNVWGLNYPVKIGGEVSIEEVGVDSGFKWLFSGVYGPAEDVDRDRLWDELGVAKTQYAEPWCISGDSNVVRFPSERSR
ncbi:hypothetical protein AAC387_Pa09g0343 [Persea americana]